MLWFTGFELNLLLSYVSLFHCVAYDIFLLFSPSTRLMWLGCKMSSLWVTVTVIAPCMSLHITTLMRCCMSTTTFGPLGVYYCRRPMRSSIPCSKMTPTTLTLPARCSSFARKTIGWWPGGGTLTNITLWTMFGTSLLIVLLWTWEITPQSFLMPWMTSTGEFCFAGLLVFCLFVMLCFFCFSLNFFCRSIEHDHVKDNLPAKLPRIQAFGEMKLEEFKDLISVADYKVCESKIKKNPTWYPHTLDVFVKFLYKVILLFIMLVFSSSRFLSFAYVHFCLY